MQKIPYCMVVIYAYLCYYEKNTTNIQVVEKMAVGDVAKNFWQYYDDVSPVNVMVVGMTNCTKWYRVERPISHIMAIEYNERGTGTFVINDQTYYTSPNSAVLLTKGSNHLYFSDKKDLQRKRWIVFDGEVMEFLIEKYLPKNTYYFENCNLSFYFSEIEKAISVYQKNYNQMVDAVSTIIFRMIIEMKNSAQKFGVSLPQKIRHILDMQVEGKLDLNTVGTELNYSKNHIIRVFRDEYGLTPYKYFEERKLHVAKMYLANTEFSLKEITKMLSYTDTHYFSKVFKREVGQTPSEFRKNSKYVESIQ